MNRDDREVAALVGSCSPQARDEPVYAYGTLVLLLDLFPAGAGMNRWNFAHCFISRHTVPRRRGDEPPWIVIPGYCSADTLFPAGAGMNRLEWRY